ncbi:MAG TPA: hypothetical protein VLU38_03790 [Methanomassiliicoccales archaeon]|nr:hypothetical protein [Methanomassiliicoccales archaeon]
MKRLEEKGILVRTVESTDPRASSKKMVLLAEWISIPLLAIILLGLALFTDVESNDYWYVLMVLLFGVLPLEAVTMIYVADQYHAQTEPINIYSNGIEAYSSTFNKLRGVDGFLHKSHLVGIELRDVSVNAQGKRDYDRSITLELSNGRRRLIGVRAREVSAEAARTMSLMWSLPIDDAPLRQRRR